MRFYQTSPGQYANFAYQLPFEAMMNTMQYNDQMIDSQRENLAKSELQFLTFDALDADEEAKKNIINKYDKRLEDLTTQINKDPMNWRNRSEDISTLGRDLYKDWTVGDIGQMKKNYDAKNAFIQNWQEMHKKDPDKYRSEDFNLALNYFDQKYKGFKGEEGYNDYQTEELSSAVDIENFAETLGKGYLVDVIEKGGWWKNEKDGYYYHSNSKTERVTKEEIQNGLSEAIKSDPNIWAYHNQMKKFYGDKGDDFSKNYTDKLYNAIDRVSDKYSYTKTESDTNQMQVDQYAMMKKKQEAEDLAKLAKRNPTKILMDYNLNKKESNFHPVSSLTSQLYPEGFDFSTLHERKEGLQLKINDIEGKLKQIDKNKDPDLYKVYTDELSEQKALLDNTSNFINNTLDLAEKFFPATQVAELEMYAMGKSEFDKILNRGEWLQKNINALNSTLANYNPNRYDMTGDNTEINKAKISEYQKELDSIKPEYEFAKKNKARFGIITDYVEKSNKGFFEDNTVDYQVIDLSTTNKDITFKKSLDDVLLKQRGDIKFLKMNNGTGTVDEEVLTMGTFNQGGFSLNPFKKNNFSFSDVKEEEGLNPSDVLDFHGAFYGQDATGNPTLNFIVSSNNKIKVNDPDKYALGNLMTSYNDRFIMSIPAEEGSESMSMFLNDENPEVRNIAYFSQDPISIMAINTLKKIPKKSDYYTEEAGDNLGIRGPLQKVSFYGGEENRGIDVIINAIGIGNNKWEYELQPNGKNIPSYFNSAVRFSEREIIDKIFNPLSRDTVSTNN